MASHYMMHENVCTGLNPLASLRVANHLYLVLLSRFGLVLHDRCYAVSVMQSAQLTDRSDHYTHDKACEDDDESDAVLPVERRAG